MWRGCVRCVPWQRRRAVRVPSGRCLVVGELLSGEADARGPGGGLSQFIALVPVRVDRLPHGVDAGAGGRLGVRRAIVGSVLPVRVGRRSWACRFPARPCLWSSARRFHPIVWPVRRSSSSMMAASRVSISLSRPLNASMSSSGTPWTSPATALVPRPRARAGSCQAQPSRWVSRSLTRLALYSLSSTVAP